jgi:SAM-dependent methyltransferase
MPPRWYQDYERGRPGYPPEALDHAGLPSSAAVLNLGAGTGKLTRLLVSTFVSVVAVEPDDEMRRLLVALCPQAEVLPGSAEEIPVAGDSVDGVFAAQSFHWFANERALLEIGRVLRHHGTLVLMWNVPSGGPEPSIVVVEQLLEPHWPKGWDMPLDLGLARTGHDPGDWRDAFAQSAFEELREARLPNVQRVDPDGLVAFFASMGWIASLPDGKRLPLLDEVRSLLTSAEYVLPWETHVFWTRLATTSESR